MSNAYSFEDLIIQYSADTSFILYPPTSVSSGAFTFSSSNELVATVNENIVTINGTGSTTLTSFQEADGEYSSITTTMTLTVTLIDTVLTDFEDIIETYSDDTFLLIQPTSNNSDGLFLYTSSNETVAEIYDNIVKMVGIGSVIITATQEASGYYNSASISCNLTVNKIDTILTNVYDMTYLYSNEVIIIDEPLSNSSAPFTYQSSNSNVVQILDNTMQLINTGTAEITVTQASNDFYNSASITYTVNVTKINPELSNFIIPEKTYGDSEFDLISPNSNSDGEFIYISSNENIATIIGNTVTVIGAGIVYITATQTETDIYSSSSITSVFFINKFQPILSNFDIPEKIYGDSPFELYYPLSESDGEFIYISSNYEVATINENMVIVNGAGASTISVFQAETDNYFSAKITSILNVSKSTTILSEFSIPEKIFGDNSFALTLPTSNSDGAFIYASLDEKVASIVGNTVTVVGAGTTTIIATQTETSNYLSNYISAEINVLKAIPLLGVLANINKNYGDEPFNLSSPSSNSPGLFSFSVPNTSVVRIIDNTVNVLGAGTTTITASQAATANYLAASTICSLTVNKATATLSGFANLIKTFGDLSFSLTAPISNSDGVFSYSCSATSVASISGSTVTVIGAGTTTITALQASTSNYLETSITCTLTVNKATATLSGFANLIKTFGDLAFSLTAPISNSNGAFTYSSSATSVATVSGSTVTVIGAGTTTITASQAASSNYLAASTTCSLTVNKATATLSGFAELIKTFGDLPFSLTAPISNSDGAFSYSSSATSVASISGSTVTVIGAGTTTITASQAATANYLAASTTCSLTVNKATTTLSGFVNVDKTFGDLPFSLTAPISNSNGAFTYSSSATSVATVSGSTVTVIGAGTTTITASQAASSNYLAASTTCSLTVNKATATLSGFADLIKTFGDLLFSLTTPISNSDGAFSYSSSATSVATVSGNTVTVIGAGTTIITASQAATSNYLAASTTCSLTVNKATTTLSGFVNVDKTFGDIPFDLIAPTSNRSGVFTYSSSNLLVATVSGSTVTIIRAGTTVITALQAASSNYLEASISLTLTVNKAATSLSNFENVNKTFGDIPFDLIAPTSNRSGVFTYSSSNPLVAAVSGSSVTVIGAGTTVITALQVETNNYLESSISLTLTVNKAVPTLTSFMDLIKYLGDDPFNLTAPISNSNGAFTYISSVPSVATVSGSTVTVVKDGTTIITAFQAATTNYLDASIQLTLIIYNLTPTLNSFDNLNKIYGDIFDLTDPISTSTGEFTYSSSNENIATIVGKTVTVVGVGTVIITALQAATDYYYSSSINCELITIKADPNISNFNNFTKTFRDVPFDLFAPTSNSNGSFIYSSSNPLVATVSENTVTIVGAGSTVITAFQAATANFNSGSTNCELIVNKALPELSNFNSQTKMIYDDDFLLYYPSSTSPGSFSYISSNPNVASVSGNLVSINDGGNTTILARQEETNNYESASITCLITVLKRPTILSNFNNLEKTFGNNDFSLSEPTSNREGNYRYVSSNPLVAVITNNMVKIVGGGSSIITALQAESAEYAEGTINCVLTVFKINPKLIKINVSNENNEYQIRFQSTSDGTYSYTFSDNSAVKINSNNTLTFLKNATVIVTIHQHETSNYFKGTYSTIINHNM